MSAYLSEESAIEASLQTDELSQRNTLKDWANKSLVVSAKFWFVTALVGQFLFAYYVLFFYGGATVQGEFETWNKVLPHGYIKGDTMGNFAVGIHVLLAVIITVGGPLQLIPKIRSVAPRFHHWNGRIYMLTVFIVSLSGLYMVWTRGVAGENRLSISVNAILIMVFAILAVRHAIARNIATHRRWALRLFMVVSGVWFFRVGLMFWIFVNNGPVGFDPKSFTGPFLTFLGYAQYLLPLVVLECYFRVKDSKSIQGKFSVSLLITVLTVAMGVGIFAAFMMMWLPRL